MKKSIGLGAFGTFGSPYGFQHTFYHDARFMQNLDLNPNAIELNPDSEIFAVKKELNNGSYSVCFCIYTYAREPQSSRQGTFIGSCVVFDNCISDGTYIYECLREFHNDIIRDNKNIIDNVLQVQEAKDLTVKEPVTYKKIKEKATSLTTKPHTVNQDFFLIAAENLSEGNYANWVSFFFTQAVETFSQTGTLYFSINPTVIDYVKTKGLITVISLEEFENLTTQKHPSKQTKKTKQPEQPKPKQLDENEDENNSPKSSNEHEEIQSEVITRMWGSSWNVNDIPKRIEEHNKLVIRYNNLETKYNNLVNGNVRNYVNNENSFDGIFDSLKTYRMIVLLVLAGLFIGLVSIYLLWGVINPQDEVKTSSSPNTSNQPNQTYFSKQSKILEPTPNGELTSDDLERTNSKLLQGMTAEEVTDKVIDANPSDIKKAYNNQKDIFTEKLIERNVRCFDGNTKESKLTCKELQHIPTYKQLP
jgi:hypothetical protein